MTNRHNKETQHGHKYSLDHLKRDPLTSSDVFISCAVWLSCRFNLRHPDIEDLLAECGVTVSREAIGLWCVKLEAIYSRRLKRKHRGYGGAFFIDEFFLSINGKQLHILWRAVGQDSEVVDVYLQLNEMGLRLNGSSGAYCEVMVVCLGRSILTSCEVMV